MSKPFDEELYIANDPAKYAVIDWLHANEFYAWVNPDQFGIDVLAFRNWNDYGFEVEVKHNWRGPVFPYDTVHFSARKQKFVADNHYFAMLNDDRTYVLVVHSPALLVSSVISKDTKFTSAEQFMSVPLGECGIYRLD